MLIHDQNTVPPESKETENTNPEVETVLSVGEDEMSKFTVEEEIKEEEPSIAIPEEMLSENAETAVSEEAKPEEPAPSPEPEQEKKELTQEEKELSVNKQWNIRADKAERYIETPKKYS